MAAPSRAEPPFPPHAIPDGSQPPLAKSLPLENTATDALNAPGEECSSVEMFASVEKIAPVAVSAPVATRDPVEQPATVALSREAVENNSTGAVFDTECSDSGFSRTRLPRRRPIYRVTDGMTPGQYAVYSLMYEAGEPAADSSRIYSGGYADLRRLTGLSKRGIQNVVGELQTKQVIRIHQKPGYRRSETSSYVVPEPASVLAIWFSNGWRHAVGKSKMLTE